MTKKEALLIARVIASTRNRTNVNSDTVDEVARALAKHLEHRYIISSDKFFNEYMFVSLSNAI